jgi:hypothetical protein
MSRHEYSISAFRANGGALFKRHANEGFAQFPLQPSAISSARLVRRDVPSELYAGVLFTFMAVFCRSLCGLKVRAREDRGLRKPEGQYCFIGRLRCRCSTIRLFILAIITSARNKIATISITLPAMRSNFIRVGKIGLSTCAYQSHTCVFVDFLRKYQTENII